MANLQELDWGMAVNMARQTHRELNAATTTSATAAASQSIGTTQQQQQQHPGQRHLPSRSGNILNTTAASGKEAINNNNGNNSDATGRDYVCSFASPPKRLCLAELKDTLNELIEAGQPLTEEVVDQIISRSDPAILREVQNLRTTSESTESFVRTLNQLDTLEERRPNIGFELPLSDFRRIVIEEKDSLTDERIEELLEALSPETRLFVEDLYNEKGTLDNFCAALESFKCEGLIQSAFPTCINSLYGMLLTIEKKFLIGENRGMTTTTFPFDQRSCLIETMIENGGRYKIFEETLHVAVSIADRYLTNTLHGGGGGGGHRSSGARRDNQLIGVTALFIASKYEEVYPPEAGDLLIYTSGSYSLENLFSTERQMLQALEFYITVPSSLQFANCLLALQEPACSPQQQCVVHYVLETMLVSAPYGTFPPSLLGTAAVYISRIWCQIYTPNPDREVMNMVKLIVGQLVALNGPHSPTCVIRNRFGAGSMHRVSTMQIPAELMLDN